MYEKVSTDVAILKYVFRCSSITFHMHHRICSPHNFLHSILFNLGRSMAGIKYTFVFGWKLPQVICARTRGNEVPKVCTNPKVRFQRSRTIYCYLGIRFFHIQVAPSNIQNLKISPMWFSSENQQKKNSKIDEKILWEIARNAHPRSQCCFFREFFGFYFVISLFFVHFVSFLFQI